MTVVDIGDICFTCFIEINMGMSQDSHFQSEKAEYFQYEYYIVKDLLSYVLAVEQYILFYWHLEITYLNKTIHINY